MSRSSYDLLYGFLERSGNTSAAFAWVNGKNLIGQIGPLAEFELYQRCCPGSVDLIPPCHELYTLLPASQ